MDEDLLPKVVFTTTTEPPFPARREICCICHRPMPRTCICSALPEQKIRLKSSFCVILQHPNESKQHVNRSLPFIEHCIDPTCFLKVIGRRFPSLLQPQSSSNVTIGGTFNECKGTYVNLMKFLMQRQYQDTMIWLLTSTVSDQSISLTRALEIWEEHKAVKMQRQEQQQGENVPVLLYPNIVIIALDATWKYANEMDRANVKHNGYPTNIQYIRLASSDFDHPLFTHQESYSQYTTLKNEATTEPINRGDKSTEITTRHRFAIRTPPKIKTNTAATIMTETTTNDCDLNGSAIVYLSTAECLAYVLARIEQNDIIYHTVMKPLDLMVEQWQSHQKK